MVLPVLFLSLFDDFGYFIKPLVDSFDYGLFDGSFVPFFVVLRLHIITDLLWQRDILQKDRIIILSHIKTIIHPAIISLYTFPKQIEKYNRSQHKDAAEYIKHGKFALVFQSFEVDHRDSEGTDIAATVFEHIGAVAAIDAGINGVEIKEDEP